MLRMTIKLDGDKAWSDLRSPDGMGIKDGVVLPLESGAIQVAVLDGGMKSGLPSVCIRIELPDGRTVLAQTSARLFCLAARAIMAKYPELYDGD
jgi:hypothetical protein